jgi:molybdenum-dependent DNA-binding transcriptional regulator ModE
VSDIRRSSRLSSDEVALVLRRAAAIEAADERAGGSDGYEIAAIEEAAREVGLSPSAVRQAVAELRVGALPAEVEPRRRGRSRAVSSRTVSHQRLVTRPPEAVHAAIDRYLRTQMFELRRRSGDRSLYRQRSDLVASLRRGLDFGGAIKLEGLRTIDVVITPADDRTLVRVEAELASSRANVVAGGAAAGTAVTFVTGLTGALLAEPFLVISSLPAGALVGGSGIRMAGARWRKRRDDLAEVLAALLDRL